ncbi:MAG: cytochrome C assembly family protein [Candidatus Eutrophobiaceae bacterium]
MSIAIAIAATYLLATGSIARCIQLESQSEERGGFFIFAGLCCAVAATMHAWQLYIDVMHPAGLDLGFFNALSLSAWLIVILVLAFSLFRKIGNLLLLACPLGALAVSVQPFFHKPWIFSELVDPGLKAHVILSIFAYSVLAIATFQSLVLYLQHCALRRQWVLGISRILPPLQTTERILIQLVLVGFFLLSLSLTSGMMFVHDIFAQNLAHKTLLSFLAWIIYGTLLWGNWSAGWRGATITRWVLGGFFFLLLAYFGTKMFIELMIDWR